MPKKKAKKTKKLRPQIQVKKVLSARKIEENKHLVVMEAEIHGAPDIPAEHFDDAPLELDTTEPTPAHLSWSEWFVKLFK